MHFKKNLKLRPIGSYFQKMLEIAFPGKKLISLYARDFIIFCSNSKVDLKKIIQPRDDV